MENRKKTPKNVDSINKYVLTSRILRESRDSKSRTWDALLGEKPPNRDLDVEKYTSWEMGTKMREME